MEMDTVVTGLRTCLDYRGLARFEMCEGETLKKHENGEEYWGDMAGDMCAHFIEKWQSVA